MAKWSLESVFGRVIFFSFIFFTFTFPALRTEPAAASGAPEEKLLKERWESAFGALRDIKGDVFPLARLEQKKVVVYFWSIYCSSCIASMKELEEWQAQLAKENTELVTVHLFEDEQSKVARTVERIGVELPVIMAEAGLRDTYAVRLLPTTLVFDERHRLLARFEGSVRVSQVQDTLAVSAHPPISGKAS